MKDFWKCGAPSCLIITLALAIPVISRVTGEIKEQCPYPQFELLHSPKTPFADASEIYVTIDHGSCAGATVFVKPIGSYTAVVDLLAPPTGPWPCTGQDLFDAALNNRSDCCELVF